VTVCVEIVVRLDLCGIDDLEFDLVNLFVLRVRVVLVVTGDDGHIDGKVLADEGLAILLDHSGWFGSVWALGPERLLAGDGKSEVEWGGGCCSPIESVVYLLDAGLLDRLTFVGLWVKGVPNVVVVRVHFDVGHLHLFPVGVFFETFQNLCKHLIANVGVKAFTVQSPQPNLKLDVRDTGLVILERVTDSCFEEMFHI